MNEITVDDLLNGLYKIRVHHPTPTVPDTKYCPPNKRWMTSVGGSRWVVIKDDAGNLELCWSSYPNSRYPIEKQGFCSECCMICDYRNMTDLQGKHRDRPNHRSRVCFINGNQMIDMWDTCNKFKKNAENYYHVSDFIVVSKE